MHQTFSTLLAMFVAMSLYPEVQKKAQAELDAIVGSSRLPDIEDRDSLVYVNALVRECFRWHNVTPLGIAHQTIEDDEFRGYFIPGGTMLVMNVWYMNLLLPLSWSALTLNFHARACMHDPTVWDEPDVFRPERFIRDGKLDPDVLDPANIIFGAGRRSVTVAPTTVVTLVDFARQDLSRSVLRGHLDLPQHCVRSPCLRHRAAVGRGWKTHQDHREHDRRFPLVCFMFRAFLFGATVHVTVFLCSGIWKTAAARSNLAQRRLKR